MSCARGNLPFYRWSRLWSPLLYALSLSSVSLAAQNHLASGIRVKDSKNQGCKTQCLRGQQLPRTTWQNFAILRDGACEAHPGETPDPCIRTKWGHGTSWTPGQQQHWNAFKEPIDSCVIEAGHLIRNTFMQDHLEEFGFFSNHHHHKEISSKQVWTNCSQSPCVLPVRPNL